MGRKLQFRDALYGRKIKRAESRVKVGMIFEGGPEGADGKVYRFLPQRLRSDLEIVPFFLDVKPRLTQDSGMVTRRLMEIDGCEQVTIIWDLRPAWPDDRR